MGLIDIALIRNKAYSHGIYEIRQNGNALLLYVKELRSPEVADLLIALKGKAMLTAGNKPYVTVKCIESLSSLEMLKKVFKV